MVPDAEPRTYYDLPILKEPVWKWEIPAYFAAGGLAAGSSLLAAGADLVGNRPLARRAQATSFVALGASGVLLVADLGVPSRFHHMLRVAKPTSPMNVGSWLLAAFALPTTVATASSLLGVLPRAGRVARLAAAALAPAVATYTGVLVADTAVPVWHEARRVLPALFAAGAAASAGGVALVVVDPADSGPARRLALVGVLGEAVAMLAMERELGDFVARPYHSDRVARLRRSALACNAVGAVLLLGGRWTRRAGAVLGGMLVVTASVVERFAVVEAGRESARDPAYTVGPQHNGAAMTTPR
jgi:hypothetical protein